MEIGLILAERERRSEREGDREREGRSERESQIELPNSESESSVNNICVCS